MGEPYQVATDSHGQTVITGRFSPTLLESDSAFIWYRQNYASFEPDSASVVIITEAAKGVHFIVVGGTWCGDTKRELPRFFKTASLAHIPDANIELFGVDRSKKSKEGITDKYDVVNVPTFIVLSDGKEIGRIVESPRQGMEFDLANILRKK